MEETDPCRWLFYLTLIVFAAGTYGQQFTTDPCNQREYKEINEYRRSTGFLTAPPEKPLCDSRLRRGWFRFTNRAGGEMPTTCQETNRCGTTIPIWLGGSNPTPDDGIVMRQICANMNNSDPQSTPCCEYSEDIFMKNCGSFYVYYLYPTIDCDMAYCAGNVPPCPVGKWSATNFPPCKDPFPVLQTPPVVTGPSVLTDKSHGFQCQFDFDDDDPDQRFEIVWTFNGKTDPAIPMQLLSGIERTATLDVSLLKAYVDANISCQVRSYYVGRETTKSTFVASNTTYFGIKTPPVLTGPILPDNKSFIFQCELSFSAHNQSVQTEVVWTFDGQQDPAVPGQVIADSDKLVLDGSLLRGHLGSQVGCQARLIYPGSDIKSSYVKSNTYYVGIQISPNPVEMSEIDYEKYVTVTSTVPIICDDEQDCCLTFKLNINETSAVSLLNSCAHRICSSDWDPARKKASVKIGLVPVRTVLVPGTKGVFLAFDVDVPSGHGDYIDTFQGYKLNQVQVTIKVESPYKCSLTGDPHIMTFDMPFMTDLYLSGDFIAYVAEERDFMIQIRTVPCGAWGATCICGIVVMEKNDVIKVSRCTNADPNAGPAAIDIAYALSPGTVVRRSTDGYRFGISLQSGSEVKIESGGVNVYISVPSYDKGLGRGLCGTNDGIKDNDLMYPDGRVDTCQSRCTPNAFFESWRVSRNQSLFEVVPDPVNSTKQYCSCLENSDGNSTLSCSARPNVQMSNIACLNCPVISDTLKPSYVVGVGWVKPGRDKPDEPFVHPEVKPIDTNKQWPNAQGITEAQAKEICTQAMQKSQLYPQCQNVAKITDSISADCLADILYGGTDFLNDITAAFTTQCQLYLAQNPDNYVTNTDGDQVLKPEILDNICPVECLKHGKCGEKGQCLCEDGWEGETCMIQSGIGPQLGRIEGDNVCDIQRSCDVIHIDISNINFMDALQCRFQGVDEQGNSIGASFMTAAVFLTPTTITCTLPKTVLSTQRYNISATKDGLLFGNELPYRIFDSTCLNCDISKCVQKDTACHINNICYKNGETDKNDGNKTCDVTKSTSRWTTKRSAQDHFPILDAPPIFSGPYVTNLSTIFQCEVVHNLDDPEQVFEVLWTFRGSPVPTIPHSLLTGQERIAALDISLLKGLGDAYVGCEVRSYYTSSENEKSTFLASNRTYFGIEEPPKLSGPIMTDNSSFIFQCEVFYDARDSQGIEVVWTFNGQVDPKLGSHVISDSDRLIVLNGTALMGHLGTNIGCQARLIFPESDVVTTFVKSNTYYAGIKINPDPLEMSEIDFEKYVTITLTIPIICGVDVDCCLTIKLDISKTSAITLLNSCAYQICSSDWDPNLKAASIQVGVAPARNVLVENIKSVSLGFEVVAPTGLNDYLDIFQNHRPNKIQITVKDETAFKCSLTGDPHIMAFDSKNMIDLYKSGDYITITVEERNFMIQVRTVPCYGGSVTCICGVVVREHNDVIKVSKCSNADPNSGPASVDIAYPLSPGTVVQRSPDGYRVGILLQSGSEVKIDSGGTNLYLSIPAFDKGLGRGICGTNDGDQDNDLTHRDGKVDTPCTARCIPDAFLESWRVSGNESLFEVVPDPVNITDAVYGSSVQYCSCLENSNGTANVSCSARQNVQTANTACPNCPVVTDTLIPSYVVGVGWVRPGTNKPDAPFVHPEAKPVDTNKQWPNDQGVTEVQANDICTKAMQKSQLYPQCQKFGQLTNSIMSDCLADILYGGTTAFLDDITAAFTTQCQLTLAQNPDNYVTNTDGDQVLKPELLDNVCPIECLKHGQCGDKGQCLCQDGWEGETCLIESGKGPQLGRIEGGAICDITKRSCTSIHVEVANINYLDKLQCRVQELDEQGNIVGAPFMTTATFLSTSTITFALPSPVKSTSRYIISATKDGVLFGNELSYRVFDSLCLDCDIAKCIEKNTACHISNVCYKNGEVDKNNENKTCDITRSTSRWTTIRSEQDRVPILDAPPILTGPVVVNASSVFQCEAVQYLDDPEQVFEVFWTFNGVSDPAIPPQLLLNQERIATLNISFLKSHVDKYVGCQVRSYYQDYENSKSTFISSNATYFGIQTPPRLSGPIMPDNRSFIFQCEVIYEYSTSNFYQEIEAVWTFDGLQDSTLQPQIIHGSNKLLVLDGKLLTGKLSKKIGCQARLIFLDCDLQTRFVQSGTYFAGIQVSPNPLEISEIDFQKYVTVALTVPIICDDDLDCCLTIKLNVNQTSVVSLLDTCDHKICSSDWDPYLKTASIQVGVAPATSVLIENIKRASLEFEVIMPAGANGYMGIFQNYGLNQVQLSVRDETAFTCSMTGDPHIKGVDSGRIYSLYDIGDYIAYYVRERDFMVQIRAVPCGAGRVSCICGIVVKEGNDVVKVSKCNSNTGMPSADIAYELSDGAVVQRSRDGYRFGIYLPSGSEVKIESGGTNVYISIPAFDKGLGRGICGTNDGNADNDFTLRDGTVESPCTGTCIPNAFFRSWRVAGNESLFEVVPDPVNISSSGYGFSKQYCSCFEKSHENSTILCSRRQYVKRTNTACPNCPVITDTLIPSYVVGVGWVKPGASQPDPPFVYPEGEPLDANKQWPNAQGITESQATDICTQALQKSQLYSRCQHLHQLVESVLSDCLADILYGDTTAFLDDITSSFTTQCQLILAQDPDNYVTNTEGEQVMKPELLDYICPVECLKHGQCENKGRCVCQDGWEGETCLIEIGKGPELIEIKGGALCDIIQKSCTSVHIDVTNISYLDKLKCRVQQVDEQNDGVGNPLITAAAFLTPTTITCILPANVLSTQRYNISATKDGVLFGNELSIRVFDSTCLKCDFVECKEKDTACHISNVCYKNGEVNKNDINKTCDITKSTSRWTTKRSEQDRVPILDAPPILTGPVVVNASSVFQCEAVQYLDDPEQVFEVFWTFNGVSDPAIPPQLLLNQERIATLNISFLKSHVDKYVGCQVRSYYQDYENSKSTFISSNATYFGIQTPPRLSGPIMPDNRSFIFQCEVIYEYSTSNFYQEIEAVWTFDGLQDSTLQPQIIHGSNKLLVLDGKLLTGKLSKKIGCQARLIFLDCDLQTKFVQSGTYFAGIQVSPNPLEISEIDFEKYVTVTLTVPIICDDDLDCCLTIKLNVNQTSVVSLLDTCDHKICSSDWDPYLKTASIQVGVAPATSVLIENIKRASLEFEVIMPAGANGYMGIFQNYGLNQVQLSVRDETAFTCSMTGDPHIKGVDSGRIYSLYDIGDYIAYYVRERDFMVQIRAVPCGAGRVSCICGIVVKEGNDVVKVSKCNSNTGMPSADIAYELSDGAVVQRSRDGYRFGIYLPSGSEVKIESGGTNVYISIPAFDKGLGRGICGTNDGNADNDFTLRDGTVESPCTGTCIPNAFFRSWRVAGNESLFEVVPDPVNISSSGYGFSKQYCSCFEKSHENSTILCSSRQYVKRTNTACPNCPVITDTLIPSYVVGVGWVKPGASQPDPPFVYPEGEPLDANKQWPNAQGITESQATDICTQALQKSQLYSRCQHLHQLVESVLSDCLADILYGDTTAFLDDITSSFTTQCQLILAQDPDNYVTNTEGEQVMKPELLDYICPVECLKHGQCEDKGLCVCQDGWEGETCLIEIGKGPELIEIKGGALCDITQKSCTSVHIDVTNISYLDKLKCRVQQVDEQNDGVGNPLITAAAFLTPTTITCILPANVLSTQRYNISATKDGVLFGNELSIRVFDSTCLKCDFVECKEKDTACHISNVCYKNGEVNKNDINKTCDITKSTSRWTTKRSEQDRVPILDAPPILTGPVVVNASSVFQCEAVQYLDDPEQVFEVFWTFNGVSDPAIPPQLLLNQERIATLNISFLKSHVDKYVGCQVRSYYQDYENSKSTFISSNATYFGIQTPPRLSGPIMPDNRSFIFQCEVIYEYSTGNFYQEIEAVWTFDGLQDSTLQPQIIHGSNKLLVLDGKLLTGKLSKKIGCQARLIFLDCDLQTRFVQSGTYFAGIQVSPNPLEISEIDFEKYVTVTLTVPIICDDDLDCCLTIKLNVNQTSVVSLLDTCDHKICSSDWDPYLKTASIQVGVAPATSVLIENIKRASLEFEVIMPAGGNGYMGIFQNYGLNQVQLSVRDETAFTCSMTGDPHIKGVDSGRIYSLYDIGDYIAYYVRERDFMVQIRAVPCGAGRVSCICGIVVKEGNDVVKVSKCNSNTGMPSADIAYELSDGAVVQRSRDGYRFGIYLPSGSEVKIESGGTNVYISIPAFDKGLGRGICGTNDGNADNDFTLRDGTVESPCTGTCIPNAFFRSWRVAGNESLFEVVPDPVNISSSGYGFSKQYCSCFEKSHENSTILCSSRQYVKRTNTACPNCPVITDTLIPSYVVGVGWVKPGASQPDPPFVYPEGEPLDANKQWPNAQGITESQATDICTQALQKSQLYSRCQHLHQLVESVLSDCLADILYGDTTAFLDDITSSFTTQCQLILAQDPDNYVTNTEGEQVMKPELLDYICPVECLKHGQCEDKGRCVCQDGWEGETCLIEIGKGPELIEIKGGALCDITQKSCTSVHIDVTNISYLDKLKCRVQQVDEQNDGVGNPLITAAAFLTPTTITCILPANVLSTQRYNISATKDGVLFGNELSIRVFDSTCLKCDFAECKEKDTACHISNVCYKNGEVNKNDINKTCDITKSTSRWTTKRSEQDHFPKLETPPVLIGPNVEEDIHANFQCKVVYGSDDPEQIFEIVWTINGRLDASLPSQLLFAQERTTILNITSLNNHVDTNVGCQVRAYYKGYEANKSAFLTSNIIYFGIQTPPVLTGPVISDNKSFVFQCGVNHSASNSSQEIEVIWTVNGKQLPGLSPQFIRSSDETAVLDGAHLKGHLGSSLGCEVRLIFPGTDVKTKFVKSNTYFAAIQISPSPLEMSEIDFEKYITVISTIPIICETDLDCCLTFRLNMNETSAVSLMNSCDYRMCTSDWDPDNKRASIQIGVVPTRNVLVAGSRSVYLTFDVILPSSNGTFLNVFQNYRPTRLEVRMKDETAFKCSLTGDPHIMAFDIKHMIDLYKSGDFTALVVEERGFMIQVRTVPCGSGSVTCICGIVVKELDNIVKISKCGNANPNSGPASVEIAYKLSPGASVQRSADGYRVGVYLPSGSEVKVESGGTNVYISIPAYDKGLGRGLCGTNDGIAENDLTHRNGKVDPACTQRCIPDAFLESWRVTGNESLFNVVPDPVNSSNITYGSSVQYCSCLERSKENFTVVCSGRQNVQRTNTACPNCPVITDILIPSYVPGTGWVKPGTNKPVDPYVHPEVKPVDTDRQWPNDQGITEAQARDICTQALQKSQLYPHCQKFAHLMNSVMSDCLADILFGGTTDFLDDITASFTTQCQLILAENPDNYVTNADGDQVLKPELLDNVCPTECLKHGKCEGKGQCSCQNGWEGETCMIESGKGPQLGRIDGGNFCDITQSSCDSIHVDVTNIDFSDKLLCSVQTVDEQSNNEGTPLVTTAIFLSPTTIICTLPKLAHSTKKHKISATKNRILFGNEVIFRVFDGTCLKCDDSGCSGKSTACHISNVCYKQGETDKSDANRVCDVTKSTTDWTLKNNELVTTAAPEPVYPTRPPRGQTMRPCHFCYGG